MRERERFFIPVLSTFFFLTRVEYKWEKIRSKLSSSIYFSLEPRCSIPRRIPLSRNVSRWLYQAFYLCFSLSFARRVHILFIIIGAISFLPRAVRPVHGSEKASPRLRRNGRSSNATHLWCGAALAREGATVRDYLSPSMENRDGCVPCFFPTVKKGKKRWIGNLSSSLSPLLIAGQFYWTHDT